MMVEASTVCSMSAFRNEQMKIGISMGAVSERKKLFLAEKKSTQKVSRLRRLRAAAARISVRAGILARAQKTIQLFR
jgi:hypothetical protein